MVHLINSNYSPKDAESVLSSSRDLSYGMHLSIRDCRISSKFIELDISVHKNNLELLLEKLSSIGQTDNSRLIIEEEIEKEQLVKDGVSYFNNERFWECHEILEGVWKNCSGNEKFLVQGLILVAAGLVHYQKDEDEICISIFNRALEKLKNSSGQYHNIDIDKIKKTVSEMINSQNVSIFLI